VRRPIRHSAAQNRPSIDHPKQDGLTATDLGNATPNAAAAVTAMSPER
jgi:hypothetical protein